MSPSDLRAWRERLGWTQAEAAEALQYSLDLYRSCEQGRRAVTPRMARLIELLAQPQRKRRAG